MKVRRKKQKIMRRHPQWKAWHEAWGEVPQAKRSLDKLFEVSREHMADLPGQQYRDEAYVKRRRLTIKKKETRTIKLRRK